MVTELIDELLGVPSVRIIVQIGIEIANIDFAMPSL